MRKNSLLPKPPGAPLPARARLRAEIREHLPAFDATLQVIAEDILGADARIDLVAVDEKGGVTLILLGEAGEDLTLVALALAQRVWVRERLHDWAQFAPQHALRPEAPVQVLLLAPYFGATAQAAAAELSFEGLRLGWVRTLQNAAGPGLWIDSLPLLRAASKAHTAPPPAAPLPPSATAALASVTSVFRTGLSDADLGLSPAASRSGEASHGDTTR